MLEISFPIHDNMTPAERFFKYFNNEYGVKERKDPTKVTNEFLEEFVTSVPEIIDELETHLLKHEIKDFYIKVKNLKYLCEYSEEFNRYWLLLRAVSGGLKRLLEEPTVDHATEVYIYYYSMYGGRRKLKDENWFESLRWDFLDKMADMRTDEELNEFVLEKIDSLSSFFRLYKRELEFFIIELKKLVIR